MTITCKGCGACCYFVGSPPGYGTLLCVYGDEPKRQDRLARFASEIQALPQGELRDSYFDVWVGMKEDIARIGAMPAKARDEIVLFSKAVKRHEADPDGPCCWLDPETNECRWYEYRPSTCREFDLGGEDCRSLRRRFEKLMDEQSIDE